MAKIYDFSTKKVLETEAEIENESAPSANETTRTVSAKQSIDRDTYLLWLFSKDVDELLAKYILDHGIASRELAAVLSHRLGKLVSTTDDPQKLEEFCQSVVKRMAGLDLLENPQKADADQLESDDKGAS